MKGNIMILARLTGLLAAMLIALPAAAEMRNIEGQATYRERIAMPPGSILHVQLLDVSRADAPSKTISEVAIKPNGPVPIAFRVPYDTADIDQRMTYTVAARLVVGDKVIFRTTSSYPVLTRGAGERIDVVMELMPDVQTRSVPGIYGKTWLAEDIRGGGVIDNSRSSLTFAEDGTVSGIGGCNNFTGKVSISGNKIKFGPLAATRKACVPALGDQEQKFFTALDNAESYAFEDGTGKLLLMDPGGTVIVKLAAI
jgi:putative lipoprotein